ncbi:unnamed protein product [Clonostachys chloroleuca]|uniref:Uncharacterized protein n=1 Tax=Clonostachys chloroleuca TaxID=1926264 RepID=A0AA35PX30_9HYPO|nr:unnamed protein product [Clonostachys chloroleuca]
MAESPVQRVTRLHDLNLSHQNNLHQTDLVHRDEDFRRLKLRLLAVRDENAVLRDQLAQKDSQTQRLTRQYNRLSGNLGNGQEKTRAQEAKIKKQATEIGNLKAEIDSLGSSVQDSTKLLQEKLALSRELDRIRPELDHIQSQLAHHQSVVAEKHDLQRQLDSLEVELEQEKRARKKTQDRETKSMTDELRSRAEEAEKRLLAEKESQGKLKRQHESELAETRGQQERLEERISTMKLKLKGLQAELKETKLELDRCQTALAKSHVSREKLSKATASNAQLNRKRRVEESSLGEITIQTPGNENALEKRQAKKRGVEKTTMVEKSTFSITPFLNRSKDGSEESLLADETVCPVHEQSTPLVAEIQIEKASGPTDNDVLEGADPVDAPGPKIAANISASSETRKPRGRPRAKPLGEAAPSRKNLAPVIEQDAEASDALPVVVPFVDNQENMVSVKSKSLGIKSRQLSKIQETARVTSTMGEAKKRKRKLLGAGNGTIMEDDGEAEAVARPTQKVQHGQVRKRAPLGGVKNAFAGSSFSPLKRDKRGVHASFLA